MSKGDHIYVVSALRHLANLTTGANTWWCVASDTHPGRYAVLYLKAKGIAVVAQVTSEPDNAPGFCATYGMLAANVTILAKLLSPISAKQLRDHPILKKLPALGRNFQGTSFGLEEPFLSELLELVSLPRLH